MASSNRWCSIFTTEEANLTGGEPDEVSLTGLLDTGASFDAPARPTIEV